MNISTADALHSIVADAWRRQPVRVLRTTCPFCRMPGSVAHVALSDGAGIEACRCDQCNAEWLDCPAPDSANRFKVGSDA